MNQADRTTISDAESEGFHNYSIISGTPPTEATRNNLPTSQRYVSRTESETQLVLDVIRAERRDERMFHRLINGITERHQQILQMNIGAKPSRSIPITGSTKNNVNDTSDVLTSPLSATIVSKIIDTHNIDLKDSSDRLVLEFLHQDDLDLSSSSTNNNSSYLCRLDRNLSVGDWSISGYDDSDTEIDQEVDNEDDEDIFILDL